MTSVDLVESIAYALSASSVPGLAWRQEAIRAADTFYNEAYSDGYAARDRLCLANCTENLKEPK